MEEHGLAEQMLKANFASRFALYKGKKGIEEAKQAVQCDPEYIDAAIATVRTKVKEERAKLALEKLKLQFSEWQTRSANQRRI